MDTDDEPKRGSLGRHLKLSKAVLLQEPPHVLSEQKEMEPVRPSGAHVTCK